MLEIYNEQVRDLQVPIKKHQHEGLKIRQHPKLGFYVEGLKVIRLHVFCVYFYYFF